MPPPRRRIHNIEIGPSDEDWLAWGQLVERWILEDAAWPRPNRKDALVAQMTAAGVRDFEVKGADGRRIDVSTYDSDGERTIVIPIPTIEMLRKDRRFLRRVFNGLEQPDHPQAQYPIPGFYDRMYNGAPTKRVFARFEEMEEMGLRRLGEYVINECM